MSVVEKKYLYFDDALEPSLEELLEYNHENAIDFKQYVESSAPIDFAAVGDHYGSYQLLRAQLTKKSLHVPLVSTVEVEDHHDFVAAGGRAIIDAKIGETPAGAQVLQRLYLPQDNSLHLQNTFKEKLQNYKSIKITSVLSVGYYADIIAYDAYSAGFSAVAIRAFVTHLTTYYAYLAQAGLARFPLDVEYASSDSEFMLQFNIPVRQFVSEYILESFTHSMSGSFPFKSLLAQSIGVVDLLDICYLKKGEKLVVAGIWQKNKQSDKRFPTLLISEVDSFKQKEISANELVANPKLALEQLQQKISNEIVLPGALKVFSDPGSVLKKNPLLLSRLIRYIEQIRRVDEECIAPEKLETQDIDSYLQEYPNRQLIEKLTEADKQAIIQALLDPESLLEIETRIKGVTQHLVEENQVVKGSDENEEFFKQVISSLDEMDHSDVNEWVRGSLLERDENTLVKGKFDEDDSFTRIAGSPDEQDDSKSTIKGVTQIIKNEMWQVKSSGLKEELKSAVMQVKSLGGGAQELKGRFAQIMNKSLDLGEDPSVVVGENMLASAISRIAAADLVRNVMEEAGENSSDQRVVKLLQELEHKNSMLDKMRKIISALKVESESAKSTEMVVRSLDDDKAGEAIDKIVAELRAAERNIKSRDQVIENLKLKIKRSVSEDTISKEKNNAKAALDSKEEKNLAGEYHKVKGLYQSTQAMLEVSNRKIAILTSELHEANQHAKGHDNVGMARLKDSLKNAQNRLIALQREKTELQTMLKKMQIDSQQVQNLQTSSERQAEHQEKRENAKIQEQEKLLERLKSDLNAANEKHRDAMAKLNEQTRMVKALELQLKNAGSLEKKNESKFATVASEEDKNAYKVKQLETVNERLEEANKKAQADLNERKKELMQMKAENTMMKNKLQALERKVKR